MDNDLAEHVKIAGIPGAVAEQSCVMCTLQKVIAIAAPSRRKITFSAYTTCTFCAALGGGACGGSAYRGVRACSRVVLAVGVVQGACVCGGKQ